MEKQNYSFKTGWSQVKLGDVAAVRAKLMKTLNINTRMAFLDRLSGKVIPRINEYYAIEKVFAEYGIKNVWGAE
jgi:hypothetical protein